MSLICKTGICNIDYSTLRNAFVERGGKTLFGVGIGSGEDAATKALENLTLCPMLRTPVNSLKADNLIVNITGGPNLGMGEVTQIMNFLHSEFGGGENTAMGAVIDENQGDTIEVFILGTTNLNSSRRLRKIPEASQREELLNFDQPDKTSKTKGPQKWTWFIQAQLKVSSNFWMILMRAADFSTKPKKIFSMVKTLMYQLT